MKNFNLKLSRSNLEDRHMHKEATNERTLIKNSMAVSIGFSWLQIETSVLPFWTTC
jgi:hypothetical protein